MRGGRAGGTARPRGARPSAFASGQQFPCRADLAALPPGCSKCLFELAVLSLNEQGLLSRHGFGGCSTALYAVAEAARGRAEEIAYRDFPGAWVLGLLGFGEGAPACCTPVLDLQAAVL